MAASQDPLQYYQYGVFKVLKSYNRISLETFSIQILFFKNLYHLNSKSKKTVYISKFIGFIINFYSACFLRTKEIVWDGVLNF